MNRPIRAVQQAAPVGTLVVTVGGSPVPVLLAMLALRPHRVIAIHTAQSRVVWQRVEELYRRIRADHAGRQTVGDQGHHLVVETCQVAPHEASQTVAALVDLRDGPAWSLAYAGGTPTISAAAFGAWWEANGDLAQGPDTAYSEFIADGPGAWYVAEDGDSLIRHDGVLLESRDVLAERIFTLVDVMRLHGMEPLRDLDRWTAHLPSRTPMDVARQIGGMRPTYRRDQRAEIEAEVQALLLDAVAHLAGLGGGRTFALGTLEAVDTAETINERTPADIVVVNGLSIGVLRPAVFPRFPVEHQRPEASGRPTKSSKIDFVWTPGQLKEQLFDAQRLAQAIGGIRARCAVQVLTGPNRRGLSPELAAVVDAGPDFRPGRLGLSRVRGVDPVDPLPAITGFNRADLAYALLECAQGTPLTDCDEMSRWLAWETEV